MRENNKKAKRVYELPAWFDLKKYQSVKDLNLASWYEQFIVRYCIYNHSSKLTLNPPEIKESDDPHLMHALHRIWRDIQNQGVVDLNSPDAMLIGGLDAGLLPYLKGFYESTKLYGSVSPIDFSTFDELNEHISEDKLPVVNSIKLRPRNVSIVQFLPERFERNDFLKINLVLPIEQLEKQFRQYVENRKNSLGFNKYDKWNAMAFKNKWYHYYTLQFLDLTLWEKINDMQIDDEAIFDVLFKDKNLDFLRGTATDWMHETMTEYMLVLIGAWAADEKLEKTF